MIKSRTSRTARTYLKINSTTNAIFLMIQLTRKQFSIMTRSAFCKCNSLDEATDSNSHSCQYRDAHVTNSVLLTVKNLRRMRDWIVSKTSSEIAVRSNWALSMWMWDEMQKIEKISKSDIFNAIATTTFFAFNFSSNQLIDFSIRSRRIEDSKRIRIQNSLSLN